jgi:hypothetical protein
LEKSNDCFRQIVGLKIACGSLRFFKMEFEEPANKTGERRAERGNRNWGSTADKTILSQIKKWSVMSSRRITERAD